MRTSSKRILSESLRVWQNPGHQCQNFLISGVSSIPLQDRLISPAPAGAKKMVYTSELFSRYSILYCNKIIYFQRKCINWASSEHVSNAARDVLFWRRRLYFMTKTTTEAMMVGHFPQAIICIDISCPYITPGTNWPQEESHAMPTLMQFPSSESGCTACQDRRELRPLFPEFNLKIEKSGKLQFDRITKATQVQSFNELGFNRHQLHWLFWWWQQWSWWYLLCWWCWWCQWSSMASWPYIRQAGKKHNCRHFQWQSEGRLLFPYDGQGNMLIVHRSPVWQ